MSNTRSLTVTGGLNVIFKKEGVNGLVIIPVEAPAGAKLLVDIDAAVVDDTQDAYTIPAEDYVDAQGVEQTREATTYVPHTAPVEAISYRKSCAVSGTPPKFAAVRRAPVKQTSLF
jgi:hypothetical protein